MDINIFIYASIGISTFISTAKASFPFETGPLIFDPYGSFFASSELDPFAVRKYANHIPNNGRYNYMKKPSYNQRNRLHDKSINSSYRASKSELSPSKRLPIDKMQSEFNIPFKLLPKKKYQKMRLPAPKHNGFNYKVPAIRPNHDEDRHIKKQFPLKTDLYNQKVPLNYRNSNLKHRFSRKPAFDEHSIYTGKTNRLISPNLRERPSTYDIDLSSQMSISSDDEPKQNIRHKQNKVQYVSPPHEYNSYFPQNYYLSKKGIGSRSKRPGLYEMDPPKNLHMNRPRIVVQNIQVPHQTLLEIADVSGPKYDSNYKSNVFNDFYHNSRPKSSEVIVNNLNDGMTTARQVGASMSVKPNGGDIRVMGKVFDESLGSALNNREMRKPEHYKKYTNSKVFDSDNFSFSTKPIKIDEMRAFHSKPIQALPNYRKPYNSMKPNDQNSETHFHNENPERSHQQPFNNDNETKNNKIVDVKSNSDLNDDKYETDYEDHEELNPYEDNGDQSEKQSHQTQHLGAHPTQRTQPQHFVENLTQKPLLSYDSNNEKSDQEESEEWSSSGIPGEPGKDYPLLSAVPLKLEFSCAGKPHGFYADISQKCQVYHQCSSQGAQKFLCPNGTLFNQESLVCEWWYNTQCENSDKLYHKNAQLYQPNHDNQNNNENRNNNDGPTNSWNYNRNINNNYNNNNNNNNNNRNNNNNYIKNSKMNQNYYPNEDFRDSNEDSRDSNDYKISSNMKEQYSIPDSGYDQNEDEINVDLSSEEMSESREKLSKAKFTDKLVSNVNSTNKISS